VGTWRVGMSGVLALGNGLGWNMDCWYTAT
jgi:hypothetical protein